MQRRNVSYTKSRYRTHTPDRIGERRVSQQQLASPHALFSSHPPGRRASIELNTNLTSDTRKASRISVYCGDQVSPDAASAPNAPRIQR